MSIEQGRLLRIADDYLTAVCELVVRAQDATSEKRLAELKRAVQFAEDVLGKSDLPF